MSLDPNEIYEKLVTLGDVWAAARLRAEQLDRATKPLVSKLSFESGEGSHAAKEASAHRHADYKQHCLELADANHEECKARIRYNAAITWSELMRTVSANERAANRNAV